MDTQNLHRVTLGLKVRSRSMRRRSGRWISIKFEVTKKVRKKGKGDETQQGTVEREYKGKERRCIRFANATRTSEERTEYIRKKRKGQLREDTVESKREEMHRVPRGYTRKSGMDRKTQTKKEDS